MFKSPLPVSPRLALRAEHELAKALVGVFVVALFVDLVHLLPQ